MRSSTVGSCCSAGRYSLLMIDGGTFQVGLMVMYFIVSLSSGVALAGLPTTTFVVQSCVPSLYTLSMNFGWVTMSWALPRARGYQRQRSMLAITISAWWPRGGSFRSLMVSASRLPVTGISSDFWNFLT